MRGVGHELTLRVHGCVECAHRALERVEHRVEASGKAPELITAGWLDASAEVLGARHVLGRLGEPLQRLHRCACDEPAEQCGERDAADDQQCEDQAQAAEQAVEFAERQRELHRASLADG